MSQLTAFDDESLAIRLALEDFEQACENVAPDQKLAFELYRLDLNEVADIHDTCALQQKIAAAVLDNNKVINEALRHEKQAIEDRQAAARLSGRTVIIPAQVQEQAQLQDAGDGTKFASFADNCSPDDDDDASAVVELRAEESKDLESVASTSDSRVQRFLEHLRSEESKPQVECIVCTEEFHPTQAATLDCRHIWCRHCLTHRFQASTDSETSWPPRCCAQTIPAVDQVLSFLSPSLRARYAAKSIEWGTTERTYCHEKPCSEFILPNTIQGRWAHCPRCQRDTCSACKGPYHTQLPCQESSELDDMLRNTAAEFGWPQCPGCNRYVEITHGCNHMT